MEQNRLKKYYYKALVPTKVGISLVWLLALALCSNISNAQITAEPDCPTAYPICDASQPIYFEVNGPGTIDDANGATFLYCQNQTSVSQFESKSAWFTFTPKYSGELGFYILPEVNDDWEFLFFGNNPDCADLQNTSYWSLCNTITPESPTNSYTGSGVHPIIGGGAGTIQCFEDYVTVNAGEKYILFITPFVFDGLPTKRATLTFQGGLIATHGADAFEQAPCLLSVADYNLNNIVSIYPNPVKNKLNITTNTKFTKLELYTITGKRVIQQEFTTAINTTHLSKGVYLLKLYTKNGQVAIKKVVKQ